MELQHRDRRTTRGSGRLGSAQQPAGLPWKIQDAFLCQKSAEREGIVNGSRENVGVHAARQEREGEDGSYSPKSEEEEKVLPKQEEKEEKTYNKKKWLKKDKEKLKECG